MNVKNIKSNILLIILSIHVYVLKTHGDTKTASCCCRCCRVKNNSRSGTSSKKKYINVVDIAKEDKNNSDTSQTDNIYPNTSVENSKQNMNNINIDENNNNNNSNNNKEKIYNNNENNNNNNEKNNDILENDINNGKTNNKDTNKKINKKEKHIKTDNDIINNNNNNNNNNITTNYDKEKENKKSENKTHNNEIDDKNENSDITDKIKNNNTRVNNNSLCKENSAKKLHSHRSSSNNNNNIKENNIKLTNNKFCKNINQDINKIFYQPNKENNIVNNNLENNNTVSIKYKDDKTTTFKSYIIKTLSIELEENKDFVYEIVGWFNFKLKTQYNNLQKVEINNKGEYYLVIQASSMAFYFNIVELKENNFIECIKFLPSINCKLGDKNIPIVPGYIISELDCTIKKENIFDNFSNNKEKKGKPQTISLTAEKEKFKNNNLNLFETINLNSGNIDKINIIKKINANTKNKDIIKQNIASNNINNRTKYEKIKTNTIYTNNNFKTQNKNEYKTIIGNYMPNLRNKIITTTITQNKKANTGMNNKIYNSEKKPQNTKKQNMQYILSLNNITNNRNKNRNINLKYGTDIKKNK